jgi:hypothetical protein
MAVYDKLLERAGYRIVIYVDADVAVRMIAGFEERGGSEKENLARALINCGFCGRVEMVRPHALEFRDYVSSWAREEQSHADTSFWERVDHYLSDSGLKMQFHDFLESANHYDKDDSGARTAYLEQLRVAGVRAFLAFENALGPWTRRLRRLYGKLLVLDQPGPEMRQLLAENPGVVNDAMGALRAKHARPYRSIGSDYHDACALGALYWLRRRDERELRLQVVRFYTETNVLQSVMTDRELLSDLSYEADYLNIDGMGPEPRRILRTADYFLMRCRFKQLSFSSGGSPDELTALIQGIDEKDILRLENSRLQKALNELEVEGRTLASIIPEFEDLSLVRGIWNEERIPEAVLQSLPKWAEVATILTNNKTVDLVNERIDDIEENLGEHVSRISSWMADFSRLARLAKDQRGRRGEGFGTGEADTAEALLGMRRWGISLARAPEAVNVLDRIAEAGSVSSGLMCQHVATTLERARSHVQEAEYVSAILWGLGDYSRIVTLLSDLERTVGLKVSLTLLKFAASLKGDMLPPSGADWLYEWQRIIDELAVRIASEPEDVRGPLRVGLAYLVFHMAKTALPRAQGNSGTVKVCREWQELSAQLGEEAKRELTEETLPWALAVNHCAYVGLKSGGPDQTIIDNVLLLRRCEEHRTIWNARFSDTVGYYYIWRFKRMRDRVTVDQLRSDLREARKYLDRARQWAIGDIAVAEHQSELEQAELELEVIGESKP